MSEISNIRLTPPAKTKRIVDDINIDKPVQRRTKSLDGEWEDCELIDDSTIWMGKPAYTFRVRKMLACGTTHDTLVVLYEGLQGEGCDVEFRNKPERHSIYVNVSYVPDAEPGLNPILFNTTPQKDAIGGFRLTIEDGKLVDVRLAA